MYGGKSCLYLLVLCSGYFLQQLQASAAELVRLVCRPVRLLQLQQACLIAAAAAACMCSCNRCCIWFRLLQRLPAFCFLLTSLQRTQLTATASAVHAPLCGYIPGSCNAGCVVCSRGQCAWHASSLNLDSMHGTVA
jgi:hypothetical protein